MLVEQHDQEHIRGPLRAALPDIITRPGLKLPLRTHPDDQSRSGAGRRRERAHGALYFAVQQARGGVTPEMIRVASQLLDAPASRLTEHVRSRLREVFGAPESAEFEWLATQPPVERSSLLEPMGRLAHQRPRGMEVRRTSGSTGVPFTFVKSLEMVARMDAAMWAVYGWHGVGPGLPHARFWGTPPSSLKRLAQCVSDRLLNRHRLGAFDTTSARSLKFFNKLARFRPAYAYGYPNVIRRFVEHCLEARLHGGELGCRVVICTGELLPPETRALLAQFFGCPVINEYGCTESGVLGFECEMEELHAIPVAAYPEVLGSEGLAAQDGEDGEVVVTDLYGTAAALLRYRLHDGAARLPPGCQCGRQLPRLKLQRGRLGSFIRIAGREPVFATILAYTVPAGVSRFRAVQTALDRLDAEIVVGDSSDAAAVAVDCRQQWERALGPGLHVFIAIVREIPAERSGKLRYFVPLAD